MGSTRGNELDEPSPKPVTAAAPEASTWWSTGTADPIRILARLRAAERRHTAADGFDAFYRFYVTALVCGFGFYLSLGLVDSVDISPAGIAWARENGRLWVGLVAAVTISAGVRSGVNGGPLALDELEIHHVLSSPLTRTAALTAPTRRLITTVTGVGAVLGAAAGELAARQLPGRQIAWVVCGLLAGSAIGLSWVSAALIAQGSPRRRRLMGVVAVVLPAWAVVDLITGMTTSPSSFYGVLALWPLDESVLAVIALAVTTPLAVWGWRRLGRISVERAHHRAQLIRQIRFAIAQQDIRSLLVLRRQLGFERSRNQPWVTIRGGGRLETRFPVLVRDARSYARWPATRLVRTFALAITAGLAAAGVWHGTTALIGLLGVSIYVSAIEVIEPLSQEFDHPGILELMPIAPGGVFLAHAISAIVAMTAFWLVVGGIATAATLDWHLGVAIAVGAAPAAAAAVAAAALSIKRFDSPALIPSPEVEGPRLVLRLLWPPALATTGVLPLLVARSAAEDGLAIGPPSVNAAAAVALLAAIALAWVRFRDEAMQTITQTQAQVR